MRNLLRDRFYDWWGDDSVGIKVYEGGKSITFTFPDERKKRRREVVKALPKNPFFIGVASTVVGGLILMVISAL